MWLGVTVSRDSFKSLIGFYLNVFYLTRFYIGIVPTHFANLWTYNHNIIVLTRIITIDVGSILLLHIIQCMRVAMSMHKASSPRPKFYSDINNLKRSVKTKTSRLKELGSIILLYNILYYVVNVWRLGFHRSGTTRIAVTDDLNE